MQEIIDSEVLDIDNLGDANSGDSLGNTMVNLEDRVDIKILEETMKSSYLSYAMSVIVSRALPDVRDGLKPVHRRIIYAMHKLNLTPGSKYMKCSRVVGDVLGKFHPHGDASVYNALARLAQDFSVRYTLVDGQGNFGSIDGDSPAAMRYTESRMDKPASFIVADIEKDTVDLVDNYDGSQKEPQVLPALFPNLIVNGQTGIAVGMATEIPPHNLSEVVEALLKLLDNPQLEVEDLMESIKGPDLPTGGIIYGKSGILEAYKTGRGKCTLRSKAELTENKIIINEIPFQINKSELLIKIAGLVSDKKIVGIRDIRDESNKDGIRIVIETKRDASPEVILNQLFKMSDLQINIHFNMLALVNRGRQPKLLTLKEILEEYLAHRDEVVIRRTNFDLRKAEDELHILDGLKIALDFIDEVIKLIRGSYDKDEASDKLQKRFKLSQRQAEAILQMRLQTLTNLDKSKIEDEREVKIALIAKLQEILNNPAVKKALIAREISEMSEKLYSKRKTQIIDHSIGDYNKEDFIEEEDVLIQMTQSQYIKVLPITNFRQQGRGGVGVTSINPKDEDWVKASMVANSHDYIYAFTNFGRVFRTRVFELPSGSRVGRGQALINYLDLREEEKVSTILTVSKEMEENQEGSIVFATKKGIIKRTKLSDFKNVRKTGIIAITLKENDKVIEVKLSSNLDDQIIMSASNGKTAIFGLKDLSPLGRTAQGVKGMRLKKDDALLSLQISNFDFKEIDLETEKEVQDGALIEETTTLKNKVYPSLLVVTEKGFGKQTFLGDYRKTKRAAGGVKTLNLTKKTGAPVLVQILNGSEESLIVTTKKGVSIRIDPADISQLGRNTQGVKVIRLHDQDKVVSGSVV
jgi:DNA gyrase subunit A